MKWKIVATVALIAGTNTHALAQASGPPAPPITGATDSVAASRSANEQQQGYNRIIHEGVKVTNANAEQPVRSKKKGLAAATAADIAPGAAVRDKNGVQIATIETIEADGAVVRSADRLAKLPLNAFGKDNAGLLIGISADEFQAAIAKTSVPVPQAPRAIADATAEDMKPGVAVRDSDGVAFGTVDKLAADGVILLVEGRKVKLALNSFAKDEKGPMIGITASELKAMIGPSAAAKTGGQTQ